MLYFSSPLSPSSFPPTSSLSAFVCVCMLCVRVCVSPKITLCYPRQSNNKWQHHCSGLSKYDTKKVCCCYINLQQPPNRPLWVLYLSPFSLLSSPCKAVTEHPPPHPFHSASLEASVEIRSSLSEVLCHVAQGAWNSPRAVEQTQAQGLSIAAPQTNCLSNEPPSLSCPHTHTLTHTLSLSLSRTHTSVHALWLSYAYIHTKPIWFKE